MPGAIFGGSGKGARITGNPVVGGTFTCTLDPGYTGTPTYQWLRDGVAISGATASIYTVVSADAGAQIACRVSGITYTTSGFGVPIVTPPVEVYVDAGYVDAGYVA